MATTTRRDDYVGDPCIALAHRWEPECLFVIFTAYFDESDTHGPSPTVVLGAFVGHAYQWRRFETKLRRIQERFGFNIFHAKDFVGQHGEFSGWGDDKCAELIAELAGLVRSDLTHGLAIYLERERYLTEYRAPPIPRKLNLDSQYGACFRGCMGFLLGMLEHRGNRDKLHVVMERGHPNVWDCERIFNDLKRRFRHLGHDLLGTWAVETKEDCPPLMMADMIAATIANARREYGENEYPAAVTGAPPHTKGSLALLELAPGALSDLKRDFEKLRLLEMEAWRGARAARKAASEALRSPQPEPADDATVSAAAYRPFLGG